MLSKSAIFRVDGSVDIGIGHLMRCATLAHAMKVRGWQCSFVASEFSQPFIAIANLENFDIHYLAEDDSTNPGVLAAIVISPVDLMVIDSYVLDKRYEAACRAYSAVILAFDDIPARMHDCDVLLDQNFGRKPEDYKDLVSSECKVLAGADKALLRDDFVRLRSDAICRRDDRKGRIDRIMISIGGSDPWDATSRILDGLEGLEQPLKVDIVLSSKSPKLEVIHARTVSNPDWRLHVNTTKMADLTFAADLVFGAGGTTSWERCCLAAPTVLVEVADNQTDNINGLVELGAGVRLGLASEFSATNVSDIMNDLLADGEKVQRLSSQSRTVCDGRGIEKLLSVLETLACLNGNHAG